MYIKASSMRKPSLGWRFSQDCQLGTVGRARFSRALPPEKGKALIPPTQN